MFSKFTALLLLLFSCLCFEVIECSNLNCVSNSNSFSSDSLKFLETSRGEECDPILVTLLIDSLRNSSIEALFTDSIPDHLCQVIESLSVLYEKDVITRNCSLYTSVQRKGSSGIVPRNQQTNNRTKNSGDEDEVRRKAVGRKDKRSPFVRISPSNLEYSLGFLHHFLTRNNVSRFIILVIYDGNRNDSSSTSGSKLLSSLLSSLVNWDQRQIIDGFIFVPSHSFHSSDDYQPVSTFLSSLSTQCKFCVIIRQPDLNLSDRNFILILYNCFE